VQLISEDSGIFARAPGGQQPVDSIPPRSHTKLGVPPTEVVKPKDLLLTEVRKRYCINESEIPLPAQSCVGVINVHVGTTAARMS